MAYRRIFASPHVLSLSVSSVVARLPVGMTGLAFVIYVQHRTGSFGAAGLVAGAGTIGLAATAPVLGRLVDRRGPRPVLVPAMTVSAAALVGAVVLGEAGAGTAVLVVLDVALPAFGVSHGSAALGGPFGASLAFGSALGALAYGAAPERFGSPAQLTVRLAIFQPLICLPLLLAPSVGVMLVLGVLAGTFIAPTITTRTQIAKVAMPPGTGTEVFTWLSLSIMIGASAGSALAGPIVESGGWRAGVLLAAALPALGLPLLLARRHLLPSPAASFPEFGAP